MYIWGGIGRGTGDSCVSMSEACRTRRSRRASEDDHTVLTPRGAFQNTKREMRFQALLSEGGSELSLAIV
jgi:hypothetical protein